MIAQYSCSHTSLTSSRCFARRSSLDEERTGGREGGRGEGREGEREEGRKAVKYSATSLVFIP